MRTMGQKRAEFALKKILSLEFDKVSKKENEKAENEKTQKDEFKSFVAGAASMILQNGLGQTLAFWYSKASSKSGFNKYKKLYSIIKEWLNYNSGDIKNEFIVYKDNNKSDKDFILYITEIDQSKYIEIQNEVISLLEWLKRYAACDF